MPMRAVDERFISRDYPLEAAQRLRLQGIETWGRQLSTNFMRFLTNHHKTLTHAER